MLLDNFDYLAHFDFNELCTAKLILSGTPTIRTPKMSVNWHTSQLYEHLRDLKDLLVDVKYL